MQFIPMTEEEINLLDLIEPGIYQFLVMAGEDVISKNGNEMIKLTIKIWDKNGSERIVFDYLLTQIPHKIRHFCTTTDQLHKYEQGTLSDRDCKGKSGNLKLGIQKDKTGQYKDKNVVIDYVPTLSIVGNENIHHKPEEISDNIPF